MSRVAATTALGAAALALATSARPESPSGLAEARLTIRGISVTIELPESRAEKALGLGKRPELAWGRGMLFRYDKPGFYGFWMKDVEFDLDFVWLRDGRVVQIHARVPHGPVASGGEVVRVNPAQLVDAVLEVPAGFALASGWSAGDRVAIAAAASD